MITSSDAAMHAQPAEHVNPVMRVIDFLQEFSMPLILGVILGLVAANVNHHWYETVVEFHPFGHDAYVFGHALTIHFIINGMFMCLFFGIAAKEITESTLPGGVLNPLRRACQPPDWHVGRRLRPRRNVSAAGVGHLRRHGRLRGGSQRLGRYPRPPTSPWRGWWRG